MSEESLPPGFEEYASESDLQSGVGSPGKDGQLELVFAPTDERTRLVHDFARVPFHVTGEVDSDPHPNGSAVCIQSPSGGIVQGDRQTIDVEVRGDAVAYVGFQSASKVQSMNNNYASTTTTLSVDAGGHLDYFPEPTILHANARYHDSCTLSIQDGATAIVGNVVIPGRLSRGEWFDFDRYHASFECRDAGGLLFADRERHDETRPSAPGVLNEYDVYGSLFAVVPSVDADELHSCASDAAEGAPDARAGATALPNGAGVVVRAVGSRSESVTSVLQATWDIARESAIGSPAPGRRSYRD
jgi:urease accessory protein